MGVNLNGMNVDVLQAYQPQTGAAATIEQTLSKDVSESDDEELMKVCKEFETYFAEQVFKALQNMVPKSEEEESSTSALPYFKDMLTQEYAKSATEGEGLGLAQMLFESMKRNHLT